MSLQLPRQNTALLLQIVQALRRFAQPRDIRRLSFEQREVFRAREKQILGNSTRWASNCPNRSASSLVELVETTSLLAPVRSGGAG